MSKKNNEDQHSLGKKATAVLTGMVGAAAFYRLGGDKLVAQGVPKAAKFLKSVSDDLSDMALKDYDAENIGKMFRKHISDADSTLNRLARSNERNKLEITGNTAIAAIVKHAELTYNPEKTLKQVFKSQYADDIVDQLSNKYELNDNHFKEQLGKLTRNALDKNNLVIAEDGVENIIKLDDELIESFIDVDKLGENKNDFFDDLVNSVKDSEIAFKEYKDKHMNEDGSYDLIENAKKQFTGKTFAEAFGVNNTELDENNFLKDKRGLTFKDFRENIDSFEDREITINGNTQISLKETILKFMDENPDIENVLMDAKNLKIKSNGDIVNYQELNGLKKDFMRELAGTLPGKLAKVTDFMSAADPGIVNHLGKSKAAPLIAGFEGKEKVINNEYMQILNKIYKIDKSNNLTHVQELDNMAAMSSKHGTLPRLMNKMFGLGAEREATNKYAKWLDIGTSNEATIIDDMVRDTGIVGKISRKRFGGSQYNVIDKMLDFGLSESDAVAYRENLKNVSSIFNSISKAPNMKTLSKMENIVKSDTSKEILQALQSQDQEEIISVLSKHSKDFKNQDLITLTKTGASNRQKTARMLSITSNKLTGEKNVLKFDDMIKREAFKEVLFREAYDPVTGKINQSNILLSLRQAGVSGSEYKNSKNLAHWSIMQYTGSLYNSNKNIKDINQIKKANEKVIDLLSLQKKKGKFHENAEYIKDFADTIIDIRENYKELTTRTVDRKRPGKYIRAEEQMDSIFIRKAYTPGQYAKDMIKDINDFTKMKANTKRFGMQFIAGRNSPEYVTTYSMIPYFFTERLVEPFNKVGLGFSSKNMGSTGDMWKAIMLKRALPTAAGITAFSYLNYEAKNLTGTSITGAMAQGIANVDLGLRKIADVTGIGQVLEAERRLNPMTQYWFGEDYQNSSERKEYYENGYDAVRKGRWWAFGSASEFRGGKISYWQPNYVKRATSDWKDIGLYGSSEEKWKHSWIPTPRHPFAPIRRALDPYWLERKHYYDRPYMETAPLFSTGTPWGAVLNPTIGEIIKPVRKMHRNETRRGLADPRTLIAERNERIRSKAIDKEHGNLFKVGPNGVTNVSYTPKALADPENMMITLKAGNGKIQSVNYNGIGYQDTVVDASEVEFISNAPGSTYAGVVKKSSLLNSIEATALGSEISNSVNNNFGATEHIRIANANIMRKAATQQGSTIEKSNLALMPARIASQHITTKQDESDLLLTTSKHDFINDALFSGKQLSGIYGFFGGLISPSNGRKIRLESADKMSSFKSSFWDANVGGLGGGIMEIARRFFPHDDHSWTDINPIRNTMPDWMPERFKVGDPYRKVPKGEMRLPGKGYESIHKLRPDEFGRYGALDRMRILGDIAPWSDEYKTWRDIAQQTVKDVAGKKEIQAIKKRVEKQSRSHEFYNYKFLGTPTEINTITVSKVEGNSITSIEGQKYNLAGVNLAKGANLADHIVAGMKVQVEHLKNKVNDNAISAAIYLDGQNLSQKLINSKQATAKENGDAMDAKALTGQFGQLYGAAMEAVAHAPIPFIHSKLMRVETALESYKNERVYGTPYSTWDHPIKGFISPAFQKAWGKGIVGQGVALGGWALAEHMWKNTDKAVDALKYLGFEATQTGVNRFASVLMNATNPGAFAGSMMAAIPTGLMGDSGGLKGLVSASVFGSGVEKGIGRTAARLGATAMIAGYGITRSDKPIESTAIFSVAGMALAKQLNHKSFNVRDGAIAGAAVGLAMSAIRNPRFNKEKMFGVYTPETTKKRWDIDEYYDRLEYIKYQGLYEKAARKARILEGTNIKKIINANEYERKINKKKIDKLNNRLTKISNSNLEDNRKEELISRINSQIYELSNSEQMLRGGKYTKAAIAYKQAADSTIYGLKENASTQEVLRAIPKGDKDYFVDFMKEKDRKKRKEILKYVSPYQRRALQIAWGEKNIDKVDSNSDYFKNHFLPGVFWAGWKPTIDMENVKMKTIENEGMLLSDFGIYESQADSPAAIMSPGISNFDKSNAGGLGLQARLQGALSGAGLMGVKVSVTPSSSNGIEVIANISNSLKITEYKIREGLNNVIGTRMFY